MKAPVRSELPSASARTSHASTPSVDNHVSPLTRPQFADKPASAVQTHGATSHIQPVPHELGAELEFWQLDLDAYAADVPLDGLSMHEQARAACRVFRRDAQRYLACRHALRCVLADALACSVQSVRIETDEVGKPRLGGGDTLQFNLSHSAHVGLIALSRCTPIGVDIELIRSIVDADALALAHFTDDERAEWLCTPQPLRDQSFVACWTRKEACLKALGVGLSAPLVSVNAGCNRQARVVAVPLGTQRCTVTLYPLNVSRETVAAVALAGREAVTLARQFFHES
jgi:4'-phosphopantetheinyl transferase